MRGYKDVREQRFCSLKNEDRLYVKRIVLST